MSGLYTRFMEWIMPFLSKLAALSYYYGRGVVPAGGDLLLEMGLILGEDGLGFRAFVYRNFGEKGHPAGNRRSCHYLQQRDCGY